MLCGDPPFFADSDRAILEKVRQGKVTFHQEEWRHVSQEAQELILQMLAMNPSTRFTFVFA